MQLGRLQINQNRVNKMTFQGNWFSRNDQPQVQEKRTDYKPNWTWGYDRVQNDKFTDPTRAVEKSITTIINTCARSIGKILPEGWEFKFPEAKPGAVKTDINPIVF